VLSPGGEVIRRQFDAVLVTEIIPDTTFAILPDRFSDSARHQLVRVTDLIGGINYVFKRKCGSWLHRERTCKHGETARKYLGVLRNQL
jgi:hypothetical protein